MILPASAAEADRAAWRGSVIRAETCRLRHPRSGDGAATDHE
jgi:hypothetical protein